MKIVTHLSILATAVWSILHWGMPNHAPRPTYTGTYNVELAALALLAIAASLFAALRRMKP